MRRVGSKMAAEAHLEDGVKGVACFQRAVTDGGVRKTGALQDEVGGVGKTRDAGEGGRPA